MDNDVLKTSVFIKPKKEKFRNSYYLFSNNLQTKINNVMLIWQNVCEINLYKKFNFQAQFQNNCWRTDLCQEWNLKT